MKLDVHSQWIEGDDFRFEGRLPVLEAVLIGSRVLVTYDWMSFPRDRAARNLFCYDKSGAEIWRAEDIGMGATDAYTGITSELPLWAQNFVGVACRIDEATGVVLEQTFTK
jgi:hypothetical protein